MGLKISWRKILLLAFGMSMFASLVYEVVWTRYLSLVFGTTVYALSAVLTSFMAGLAIGSYVFGKIADKRKNLLGLFAKLEFVLGAYGILLILLFKVIQYPYFFLHSIFGSSFLMTMSLFIMAFIVLFIPTVIIGATFPLMSKIYIEKVGRDVSDVYAVDTIFGALGAFSAGFFFLPYLGLAQTAILAAVLNFGIGYIFYRRRTQ
ncbi:fused MFS/spermidine synthase [Bacteroidota bacterium]